jgi:hypothetical protein
MLMLKLLQDVAKNQAQIVSYEHLRRTSSYIHRMTGLMITFENAFAIISFAGNQVFYIIPAGVEELRLNA